MKSLHHELILTHLDHIIYRSILYIIIYLNVLCGGFIIYLIEIETFLDADPEHVG